jgi:hypothetical protein
MASPFFQSLVKFAAPYVGQEKAEGAITRRLTKDMSADAFSKPDLQKILLPICDVLTLYIDDEAKKNELMAGIKKLAA